MTSAVLAGFVIPMALVSIAAAAPATDHRLADAAERRDAAAIESLLSNRADINGAQPDGAVALHWATYWDDAALVKRLIAARANVNAANDHGVTPLALACENANLPIVNSLLTA